MLNFVVQTGLIVLYTRVCVQMRSYDLCDRKFLPQIKVLARGESMTYFIQFPWHAFAAR
jgi:hypothetical protein